MDIKQFARLTLPHIGGEDMRDRDYINSIWSKRDEAFFWYGWKGGALVSAIMIPCAYITTRILIKEFKEILAEKPKRKEES